MNLVHRGDVQGSQHRATVPQPRLLDEVRIDLVPMLLGKGIRYFDNVDTTADLHRIQVVEGDGVTHLRVPLKPEPVAAVCRPWHSSWCLEAVGVPVALDDQAVAGRAEPRSGHWFVDS